jgi:tellurite resistance protein
MIYLSDSCVQQEMFMTQITPQDALVYIMVLVSAADTRMTDAELESIENVVTRLPVFVGFDRDKLASLAEDCSALLADEDGLDRILDLAHDALPERLYDTAYALAVEVAAADLHVEQEELVLLQMLRDRWNLDELTVAAIERSARVRFRKID